ncbi:MAG: tetratricopeptide repeat protein [Alphaproteobacteria bacterium]|nr:tetratricopeptide repeat protein [Alphaproteobacteria bacterium]
MGKTIWSAICAVVVVVFASCSPLKGRSTDMDAKESQSAEIKPNVYGAYLSGRVAHIRRDFSRAADYYEIALEGNKDNMVMLSQLYLLLALQGRIDEAADYAKQALQKGANNAVANMVLATKSMHDGEYKSVIKYINKIDDPLYKGLIAPLFDAWGYAGLKNEKKMLAELNKLKGDDSLKLIYNMQKAMLFDYLGKNQEAKKYYERILKDPDAELSLRMLDIVTNFYIRSGEKQRAVTMMESTVNNKALDSFLAVLRKKVELADAEHTKPLIDHPRVGAAEALFTIVSSLRQADALDVAHLYTAITIYLNPNYSTAKILLADIFESREMFEDANKIYDSIDKNDVAYYPSQIKKARNLVKNGDYEDAEILLTSLSDEYSDAQVYMELGDILRLSDRYDEAIKFYDLAIKRSDNPMTLWVLYYAKGVALERSGKWEAAQDVLMKAYEIKPHYLVLNYIGYTWIVHKSYPERALEFIIEAYNQAPDDPNINDSLGFALYNLGYYSMALPYLEMAAEMYPSSAIISSHLGDTYWFVKRKDEAVFQWTHALSLKDDSGELDVEATRAKIEDGVIAEPMMEYDQSKVDELLKKLKKRRNLVVKK